MADQPSSGNRHGLPDVGSLAEQVREMIERLGEENGAEVSASVDLTESSKIDLSSVDDPFTREDSEAR